MKTFLKQVQEVLSAIDSEGVESLGETAEAEQVVSLVQRAYDEIMATHRWRHLKRLGSFVTASELNELQLDSNTIAFDPYNVWYKTSKVTYVEPETFLAMTIGRDLSDSNVTLMGNYKIRTDSDPTYFTSVDEKILVFDSVPHPVNGVQSSDCVAFMYVQPDELLGENDVINLPSQVIPAFNDLCLSLAFSELKGDKQEGELRRRNYVRKMGRLSKNRRIIDVTHDYKSYIVPRKGRNTGLGSIYATTQP